MSTSITIRIDENLKKQAELLFDEMGLNMTTAVTMFIKTAVRQSRIPFEISAGPSYDDGNPEQISDAGKSS